MEHLRYFSLMARSLAVRHEEEPMGAVACGCAARRSITEHEADDGLTTLRGTSRGTARSSIEAAMRRASGPVSGRSSSLQTREECGQLIARN